MADDADLDGHFQAGRAAWPGIEVDRERFVAELQRRVSGVEGLGLASVRGADVYVAVACVDGNLKAIEAVRALLAREAEFASTKTTASRDQIAEVVARLSRILFVDEPERPAALREYSGRGDLKSYLRVTAMRDLVKLVNKGRREVGIEDDELLDRIVPASDPELSMRARRAGHRKSSRCARVLHDESCRVRCRARSPGRAHRSLAAHAQVIAAHPLQRALP